MTHDLLVLLARVNVAGTCVALCVMTLRWPLRRHFGARVAYNLWLAMPIAVAACLLPLPPRALNLPAAALPFTAGGYDLVWKDAGGGQWEFGGLAIAIWSLGALLNLLRMLWSQRRFIMQANAGLAGPAVVGAMFPKVILPADFNARFTDDERRLILAHERTHLDHRDPEAIGIIALIQCACWFNPIVHVAAHFARLDQELACDEDVIAQFPHDRRIYAEAMLKTQHPGQSLFLGCSWPTHTLHPSRRELRC